MKKSLQLIFAAMLLLFAGEAFAQQGFGTNQPDKSSAVDIVSSKRGLLIPRVALTATTSSDPIVQAPAESLLVYNTATAGDVTPGYYYWQVDKWVRFVSSSTEKTVTVSQGENITVTPSTPDANTTDYTVSVKGGGTEGFVLVTKADGTGTEWVDPAEFIDGVVTADNGLTMDTNHNITLGGALNKETIINTDPTNTLAITGLEDVSTAFDSATQKIVIMGADGVLKVVSSDDIVKANETVTTLVANADGTYTYTSEDATVTIIDIPNSVIENFETIVNGGPVEINGTTYTTIEEYIEQIASASVNIDGGDMITVTGSGTTADPYVVSIEAGAPDSMLITNATGDLEWATITDIVTADNGLTKTGNNIQLGGALVEDATVIAAAADKTLAITGLQNSTADATSIVLVDETSGVLRKVARSLEYSVNNSFTVTSGADYNKFVQEITINVTIPSAGDVDITLPTAADVKGQVINVKIANTDESHAGYVNIPGVDGTTIYGSMPYQGWILKSNGSTWSIVGRI